MDQKSEENRKSQFRNGKGVNVKTKSMGTQYKSVPYNSQNGSKQKKKISFMEVFTKMQGDEPIVVPMDDEDVYLVKGPNRKQLIVTNVDVLDGKKTKLSNMKEAYDELIENDEGSDGNIEEEIINLDLSKVKQSNFNPFHGSIRTDYDMDEMLKRKYKILYPDGNKTSKAGPRHVFEMDDDEVSSDCDSDDDFEVQSLIEHQRREMEKKEMEMEKLRKLNKLRMEKMERMRKIADEKFKELMESEKKEKASKTKKKGKGKKKKKKKKKKKAKARKKKVTTKFRDTKPEVVLDEEEAEKRKAEEAEQKRIDEKQKEEMIARLAEEARRREEAMLQKIKMEEAERERRRREEEKRKLAEKKKRERKRKNGKKRKEAGKKKSFEEMKEMFEKERQERLADNRRNEAKRLETEKLRREDELRRAEEMKREEEERKRIEKEERVVRKGVHDRVYMPAKPSGSEGDVAEAENHLAQSTPSMINYENFIYKPNQDQEQSPGILNFTHDTNPYEMGTTYDESEELKRQEEPVIEGDLALERIFGKIEKKKDGEVRLFELFPRRDVEKERRENWIGHGPIGPKNPGVIAPPTRKPQRRDSLPPRRRPRQEVPLYFPFQNDQPVLKVETKNPSLNQPISFLQEEPNQSEMLKLETVPDLQQPSGESFLSQRRSDKSHLFSFGGNQGRQQPMGMFSIPHEPPPLVMNAQTQVSPPSIFHMRASEPSLISQPTPGNVFSNTASNLFGQQGATGTWNDGSGFPVSRKDIEGFENKMKDFDRVIGRDKNEVIQKEVMEVKESIFQLHLKCLEFGGIVENVLVEKYGMKRPRFERIVVDGEGRVIKGGLRYSAAFKSISKIPKLHNNVLSYVTNHVEENLLFLTGGAKQDNNNPIEFSQPTRTIERISVESDCVVLVHKELGEIQHCESEITSTGVFTRAMKNWVFRALAIERDLSRLTENLLQRTWVVVCCRGLLQENTSKQPTKDVNQSFCHMLEKNENVFVCLNRIQRRGRLAVTRIDKFQVQFEYGMK